ncbi:MAG TPA: biopolymer transporter ExbD [Myxococcaceae bacterium]|nr:biopolymer transporter ExbD [Myxococcaceae bacterium]
MTTAAHAGHPKKFFVNLAGRPTSDINVTPLVDVVLVLLIIFMVLTPLLEKDINVAIPSTEQVEDMSEVPPDQLLVALDEKGNLFINTEKIEPGDYVNRLKRMLAAKAQGDRLVFFMAEDNANYARLIAALDGAKQAGAEILGMMTEPPQGATAENPAGTPPGTPPTTPPGGGGSQPQ